MSSWVSASAGYFGYAAVCLGAFCLLEIWLRQREPGGRLPAWAWPGLGVLLVAGSFMVDAAGRNERQRIRGFLEGVAPTYAQELMLMGHAGIGLDTAPDDPTYLRVIEAMKRWKKVNPVISDLYTYRVIDGQVRFIADSETDYNHDGTYSGEREQRVAIGRAYPEADPPMFQAFEGVSTFSNDPVEDEWGVWVSAQVPLRDVNGRIEAALGVDYPAEKWIEATRLARQRMEWFLAIPILILGFGGAVSGALRAEMGARRKVEERLRDHEALLQAALDSLPSDMWVMDLEGRYILQNQASLEIWGDRKGTTLAMLPVEESVRRVWEANNRRAFAGETLRQETRLRIAGEWRDCFNIVVPVKLDGKVTGILGINVDITERVAARESHRKSEQRLALLVEQTPLAVIECDLNLKVTAWNPAAEQIFGRRAAEAIGQEIAEVLGMGAGRPHALLDAWRAQLRDGGSGRGTYQVEIAVDRAPTCEWFYTRLVAGDGAGLGLTIIAQDVSERVAMDKQLRQAQKMELVGQLAGGIAHEFNNLLTPMSLQASLIQEIYGDDARLAELLQPVEEAIRQMAELNRRILAVGRKGSDRREFLKLAPLVENALGLLRHTLDRRIELEVELDESLGFLPLSATAISQIVMNLAINARDTLLEKLERQRENWQPRITVGTRAIELPARRGRPGTEAGRVCQCLTVSDNGLGISESDRARIFEPFYTTKAAGRGSGLGLSVVWGVVNSLGGWIEVDSEPGEGTVFSVFLPQPGLEPVAIEQPSPATTVITATARPAPAATTHRLLLVEDNDMVMRTLTTLLSRAGYQVTPASDGQEAWEIFQRTERGFDLVVTDLNMPRHTGLELLIRLRGAGYLRPVVVLSGNLDDDHRSALEKAGVDELLEKPISPAKLLGAIARQLAGVS